MEKRSRFFVDVFQTDRTKRTFSTVTGLNDANLSFTNSLAILNCLSLFAEIAEIKNSHLARFGIETKMN
jgi:hypothetical protein